MKNFNQAFDKLRKHPMKILLGDFNAKDGREDIFKPTIWNESLHEISTDIYYFLKLSKVQQLFISYFTPSCVSA
jgi:hypothetical protein